MVMMMLIVMMMIMIMTIRRHRMVVITNGGDTISLSDDGDPQILFLQTNINHHTDNRSFNFKYLDRDDDVMIR